MEMKNNIAIRVDKLSKRYRIGLKEETQDTFVGKIGSIFNSPFQNLKKLKKLTTFKSDNKEYDDVIWALKDVSFEVKRGEVIGIIGANGAGKSTLLKILAQITHPTSGRVELNGRVASLLEVGTGFHPELTGRENIYLNGTILGMTKKEIDRKLDEIIEFSGVGKFIDTPVKKYSSGMRVRLAFSVAAHLDPEILLIDEVLAVGDAEFQKKCLGKMENISKEGRTIIFVSHNMDAIKNICESCILLKNGELIKNGETSNIIASYLQHNQTNEILNFYDDFKKFNNELLCLKSIRLIGKNGDLIDSEIKESEFGIKIYFEILDDNKLIVPSINVYNNQGRHLFSSFQRNNEKAIFKLGNFVSTIWIPTNHFSNGYFNVSVIFFTPSITTTERIIQTDQILRFKIIDQKLLNINSQTDLNISSSLIPEFNWEHHAF